MVKKRKGKHMKYLACLLLLFSFTAQADDSPFCLTKAYLAKDIVSQINEGLDPSNINFAFPNVRSPEEEKEAMIFANNLMHEVRKLMQVENDPAKVYNIIKEECVNPDDIKT